jgi:hypothetical protein
MMVLPTSYPTYLVSGLGRPSACFHCTRSRHSPHEVYHLFYDTQRCLDGVGRRVPGSDLLSSSLVFTVFVFFE